ncbi:hypothetical protein EG352_07210 [Chryseobacterium indologenes]|uniref:Phage tail collar domain-containing protein n=1 Tax=Chryseobacterium indologenes TaxID=253 RepID=A0AAD0YUT7_CHRID|nr:hypothetical protein [Chryseobacterium indologenes]AZB17567.1 hypothetical protein EG352_07210 [Chryseobacterium indologenes]
MKTFDFNQTGGFKLVTEVLAGLQEAYSIFNGVARMAGDKAILSGCNELGTNINDGVVVISGETLEFKGGVKQPTVIIKEEIKDAQYENGTLKPFETYRYATFGYSSNAYNWIDFKRVTPLNSIEERLLKLEKASAPIIEGGARVLWLKPANTIPAGWVEDTDFKGRSPVGLDLLDDDFNEVGKPGGSKTHSLSIGELPKHRFKIFGGSGVNTSKITDNTDGTAAAFGDSPSSNEDWNYEITSANGDAYAGNTNPLGGNQAHNNMSPYRIVIYIKYIG